MYPVVDVLADSRSYAAVVSVRRAFAWSRPIRGRVVDRVERLDGNGYPTVFAVLGAVSRGWRPVWLRVQLSMPPTGSVGWIRPWAVHTFVVHTRIVVRLARRQLIAYRYGRRVFSTRVAVRSAAAPTPPGRFFIDGRFVVSDSTGPFGVAVLAICAHSQVLHGCIRGRPIALHGTTSPASVGQASSHGCMRLNNSDMRRLFALAPAGTPVIIAS